MSEQNRIPERDLGSSSGSPTDQVRVVKGGRSMTVPAASLPISTAVRVAIDRLEQSQGSGMPGYATRLDLPTPPPPGMTLAMVTNDSNAENNGVWRWTGALWVKSADRTSVLEAKVDDAESMIARGGNLFPDPNLKLVDRYIGPDVSSLPNEVYGPAENYIRNTVATDTAEIILTPAWQVTGLMRYRHIGRISVTGDTQCAIEVVWYADRDGFEEIQAEDLASTDSAVVFNDLIEAPVDALRARFRLSKAGGNAGFIYFMSPRVFSSARTADLENQSISNAKLLPMEPGTLKGRQHNLGPGIPQDMSAATVRALLGVEDGATANSSDAFLLDRKNHHGHLSPDAFGMSDKSNMYIDADLVSADGYIGAAVSRQTPTFGGVAMARTSRGVIALETSDQAEEVITPAFPVEPEKAFYLHVSAGRWTGVGASTTEVWVNWYSDFDATDLIHSEQIGTAVTATFAVPRSGIFFADESAVRGRFVVKKAADEGTRVAFYDLIVRRAIDPSMMSAPVVPYVPPTVTATSAVLLYRSPVPGVPDSHLFAKDVGVHVAPASLIKLLAAMVALDVAQEAGLHWNTFTMTVQPADATAGSGNNLLTGDVITLRDAVSNMLLPSSNVAASVVAREIGEILLEGSGGDAVVRFVSEMNAKAESLGASSTAIINPHGLPVSGQRSTAMDMANVIMAAASYPEVSDIWCLGSDTISVAGPNARSIPIVSSVVMISDPDVLGGKTGTITPETYNLGLMVAMPNGNRVAVVVLASTSNQNRYIDARAIVDAVRVGHFWPTVIPTPHPEGF